MVANMAEKVGAERVRAVDAALANIEKKFGKGSIMRLGEKEVADVLSISTTSIASKAEKKALAGCSTTSGRSSRPPADALLT